MSENESPIKVFTLKNTVIFLLSILFIIAGVYANYQFKNCSFFFSKVIPVLLSEVGVAGLIAIFLIYTIEKHNKDVERKEYKEMAEALHVNVLESIYKRYIPPRVFTEIDKCLFMAKLYRSKLKIHYTIKKVDSDLDDKIDSAEHVVCDAFITYHLKNTTSKPLKEVIPIYIEKPFDSAWSDKVGVNSLVVTRNTNSKEILIKNKDDVNDYIKGSDDKQIIFKYPIDLEPDEELCVEARFTLIKRIVDQESWVSRIPTDSLELTVTTPNADFVVLAKACHSEALSENIDSNHITNSWSLDYGIIPHQSVMFWWKPIKNNDLAQT